MGQDCLRCLISQLVPPLRPSRRRPELESSDVSVSDESVVANATQTVFITRMRVTGISARLTRVPVGFYVAVKSENRTQRTLNKPASESEDVVEWGDEIVLPSDSSSAISLTVIASFELESAAEAEEVLCKFEMTVGELLDRKTEFELIRLSEDDAKVEIEIKQIGSHGECTAAPNDTGSGETNRLEESTSNITATTSLWARCRAALLDHLMIPFCVRLHWLVCLIDCEMAISMLEVVVQSTSDDDPEKPSRLESLSSSLSARHMRFGDIADLEKSIAVGEYAVRLAPDSHQYKATWLTNLAHTLSTHYQLVGDVVNLEKSISLGQDAVRLTPDGHPDKPGILNILAFSVSTRYQRFADLGDLDRSISLREDAVRLAPDSDSDKPVWLSALRASFLSRYRRFGEIVDLNKSISIGEDAVRLTPDSDGDKPVWLSALGASLMTRYRRLGDVMDLNKLILMGEDAVRLTPDSDADKPTSLSNLGFSLWTRYERFGDVADLEKLISVREEAVRLTPDGDPDKPGMLDTLGSSLLTRYERFRDVADLEKLISIREDVVRLAPDGEDKARMLTNLAYSLSTRYELFGDVTDLEKLISMGEDALRLTKDDDPDKPRWLNNLGTSLVTRYHRFGNAADLENAISMREDAIRLVPDEHPDKPLFLSNLAFALSARYQRFGDAAALESSISIGVDAVRLTLDDRPEKPALLDTFGSSLATRYECYGDIADLDESILLRENAARLTPDDHPDRPTWLNNLATSLLARYQYCGDVTDLEKSILIGKNVVQLTPDGHPGRPGRLNNLGTSLWIRYQRFGEVVDLEKSISIFEDAVQLIPDGHPDKPTMLNNLGSSLSARYERFGEVADLERAISMEEDAVRLTPDDHPDKHIWLTNLGSSLSTRYERFGGVMDLEKSISIKLNAVRLTLDGHVDKPGRLDGLGFSLLTRYARFGDVMDLERSIPIFENAVQLTPDGHPDKPTWLNNFGSSLSARYERFGDVADLEKAISIAESALQLSPNGDPDNPKFLGNFRSTLYKKYKHSGDIVDLEKSISIFEDAVRVSPDDHPGKPRQLSHLGSLLSDRFECLGNVVDQEKSISMAEQAVQLIPDGHPDMSMRLMDLVHCLLRRFQRSGISSPDQVLRAVAHSSQATQSHTSSTSHRFQASEIWIKCLRLLSRDNSQPLFDAYAVAINLLPQLAWIGLSFQDRYHQLLHAQAAGVASDAAAVALDLDRPETAVEWLEQGRSIMWSQLSQLRTPAEDLRSAHPGLAAQFERISHELEQAGVRDRDALNGFIHPKMMTDGMLKKQAEQHHTLAQLRSNLLTEIRALPGFERFLLLKTIDQLLSLAHTGHIVLLNASKPRCDALVITATSKKVIHVPLLHAGYNEIVRMQRQLNGLLRHNGRIIPPEEADREGGARPIFWGPDDMFKSILSDLWNQVATPILGVLALLSPPTKRPRIFWCPAGPFTLLPIHASGLYDAANPGPKLSDFVISSYIPTMGALQDEPLPQESQTNSTKVRFLAVPQSSTDGDLQLNGVNEEMAFIRELTSSSPFMDFQEADGTVEDVLAKMKESDWVHFCCHGTQDRTKPLDSGLLLAHCKRLTLSDIVQLSRPRGGIVFLSACQTAMGDEKLSDEAIHLAAGMLLAGYSGVIATMWSIMDSDAPRVTRDVYQSLFGDGKVPDSRLAAEALHHAIEGLRDSGAPFLSWVPFVHYGL